MNGNTNDCDSTQQRPMVTSCGNAWVICNSKSRPGFKYYFNSYSGQSVWNLSPDEIEKAQKYTKGLPESEIEKCPEPMMDPPVNQPPPQTPKQGYNDLNRNRQITNQLPNMIYPMNLLNMGNMGGLPGVMNPFVWNNNSPNIPVPTPPIVCFFAQPPVNIPSQQEQNVPPSFYPNSYVKYENSSDINVRESNMLQRDNEEARVARNYGEPTDLRQKLTRKRCKSFSFEPPSYHDEGAAGPSKSYIHKQQFVHNTEVQDVSKYDLSVLEQLKPRDSIYTNWFIVVDTAMILNNFPFLNKLTDPDQNCFLFIPDHVMCELQEMVFRGGDIATRRILRFLTQQIETELAFQGEEINYATDDSFKMFATCQELAKRSHVILLSNDANLHKFKGVHKNIHVHTLNELRTILNVKSINLPTRQKSPTMAIKISVPNDTPAQAKNKTVKLLDSTLGLRSAHKNQLTAPLPAPKLVEKEVVKADMKINLQNQSLKTQPLSRDVNQKTGSRPNATENFKILEEVCNNNPSLQTTELLENQLSSQTSNKTEVTQKVLLSRNANRAPTENTSTHQVRYRWRRQRAPNKMANAAKPFSSDQSEDAQKKQFEVTNLHSNSLLSEDTSTPRPPNSTMQAPSLASSSVSSHRKEIERPNITIEETSTSGITNTTFDSESLKSNCLIKDKETACVNINVEFVKFQVIGQSMEEMLKTRMEEWVLSFVQIMEETLREMLRDDSQVGSKDSGYTPWATDLPELSRCIIKKYYSHYKVVDASNNLSCILQSVSDIKGNISKNIEPQQFMDMYSYGVYLIHALKSVTTDCEDLVITNQRLKKLLYDIQNENQEGGQNDTFPELNDSATDVNKALDITENQHPHIIYDSGMQSYDGDHQDKNTNENISISPHKENQPQISQDVETRQSSKSETKFFASLALTKNSPLPDFHPSPCNSPNSAQLATTSPSKLTAPNTCSSPNLAKLTITSPPKLPSPKTRRSPRFTLKSNASAVLETPKGTNKDSSPNNTDLDAGNKVDNEKTNSEVKTCFIRNFSSIAQFEEKLIKTKSNKSMVDENDLDCDDYYEDEEYTCDDENAGDYNDGDGLEEDADYEYEHDDLNELEEGEIVSEPKSPEVSKAQCEDEESSLKTSRHGEMLVCVKETILTAASFNTKVLEDLCNGCKPSPEVQLKIRMTCTNMKNIKDEMDDLIGEYSKNVAGPHKANLIEYVNFARNLRDCVIAWHQTLISTMDAAGMERDIPTHHISNESKSNSRTLL